MNDPPGPRLDVLIIEDSDTLAHAIEKILTREGYTCARARDGAQGLAALSKPSLPRLVTLDVMMPLVSGLDVLIEIRRRERTRHLPVLMLTGVAGEKEVLRAIADGATGYLVKPFEPEELVTRVQRLLPAKSER